MFCIPRETKANHNSGMLKVVRSKLVADSTKVLIIEFDLNRGKVDQTAAK